VMGEFFGVEGPHQSWAHQGCATYASSAMNNVIYNIYQEVTLSYLSSSGGAPHGSWTTPLQVPPSTFNLQSVGVGFVGVGVPQLVGDVVEEQVPALRVHVHGEVLEDVPVAAVSNAAHSGAVTLGSDELNGLGTNIPEQ
jgi:hypothetical protein